MGKIKIVFFYICGFDPGLEYQRVLALDVDRRATHLLQLETFFKIRNWENSSPKKEESVAGEIL